MQPNPARPRGHGAIKAMAKELGVNMPELVVLARGNDPFCSGTPADEKEATWFADLWNEHGAGGHLRRLHYRLLSFGAVEKDGTPYTNTQECWDRLTKAAATARAMELVDPTSLVDRRNAPPVLNPPDPRPAPEPHREHWWAPDWDVPAIDTGLNADLGHTIEPPWVHGYDYAPEDQPVLVELWIEKSTMNDILLPLCEELGVNLVASVGFQSITNAVDLLRRAHQANKRCRVLYVSDFDPAGHQMPVAVSRQIEFWAERFAPGADLKITPVALTGEQIRTFDLPRVPIKASDRRRASFESRHGDGAVELDALEALHPGELARIIREAVTPYRDASLSGRLADTSREARAVVRRAWDETFRTEQEALNDITSDVSDVVASYQAELEALAERMAADMAQHQDRLNGVWRAVQIKAEAFHVDLLPRPEGEVHPTDESGWLFDNARSYRAQLDAYRSHRDGTTGEAAA